MDLDDFQHKATSTDQRPDGPDSIVIPLLGLAGEAGTLLSEYKKYLRDGSSHTRYNSLVREELGDILWYVANLASKSGLSLSDIAERNLEKVNDRWNPESRSSPLLFDEGFPDTEQIPRTFEAEFTQVCVAGRSQVRVTLNGHAIGEPLTDAATVEDGFRYHDALHLSFAVHLGWSPVTRRNLGLKRRSDPVVDEAQDGGRAIVVEEAVAAHAYVYALRHNLMKDVDAVDFSTLRTIHELVAPFEVSVRTSVEWQTALVEGFKAFRLLLEHSGGVLQGNLHERTLVWRSA